MRNKRKSKVKKRKKAKIYSFGARKIVKEKEDFSNWSHPEQGVSEINDIVSGLDSDIDNLLGTTEFLTSEVIGKESQDFITKGLVSQMIALQKRTIEVRGFDYNNKDFIVFIVSKLDFDFLSRIEGIETFENHLLLSGFYIMTQDFWEKSIKNKSKIQDWHIKVDLTDEDRKVIFNKKKYISEGVTVEEKTAVATGFLMSKEENNL